MDTSEICRVCVEEVNSFWYLFETCAMLSPDLTPALIISACAGIEIDPQDGLPESVCDSCLHEMIAAYDIREMCISSDRKLRKLLLHKKASSVKRATSEATEIEPDSSKVETFQQADGMDEPEEAYESVDENDCSEGVSAEPDYGDASVDLQEGALEPEYCDEEFLINESLEQLADYVECEGQAVVEENAAEAEANLNITVSDENSNVEPRQDSPSVNEPTTCEGSKRFACDICEKSFSTKGNLKAHIHLHNNYKPYQCEVCGDEFSRRHNYKIHKIRHAGKRTHQCPMCDKSFVCSVNLKNHMVKHSDVKPYRCEHCGMEFGYRTDLARHEIKHTGVYPFACDICQHKFSRKANLNRHLLNCKEQKKERRKRRSLK